MGSRRRSTGRASPPISAEKITEYLGVAHGWLYMIFLVTAFLLPIVAVFFDANLDGFEWIGLALVLGYLATRLKMPPLVGY